MPILDKTGKVTQEWKENCAKAIQTIADVTAMLEEMGAPQYLSTDLRRSLIEILGGRYDDRTDRLFKHFANGRITLSDFAARVE